MKKTIGWIILVLMALFPFIHFGIENGIESAIHFFLSILLAFGLIMLCIWLIKS